MTTVEAAAITVLARAQTDYTGRQVARLANAGTPNGIRKALLRLADVGLVEATPEPHATRYQANRGHVLWPAIEIALNAPSEVERRIGEFARTSSPGSTVAIYGSVARGEADAESDVDILVIHADTKEPGERDNFAVELAARVEQWTGNPAQVYDLTESRLRGQIGARDPIAQRWLAEARTIVGDDVAERAGT